jgi:hypothetical protein
MYKVTSPYETRFAFSRFEAEEEANPSQELGAGGDASTTEAEAKPEE